MQATTDLETSFYGLPREQCDYASARAAIFGTPFEGAVSYGSGTSRGPSAVLEASQQVELFDHEAGWSPCEVGIATLEPETLDTPLASFEAVKATIDRILPGLLADGKFPVLIGGDHSVMPPVIPHYLGKYPELGVFQIDAHADLRDQYDDNPNSHACAIRRAHDHPIVHSVGVGIRNISAEEWDWYKDQTNITMVWGGSRMVSEGDWKSEVRAAIAKLPRHVYLTIDVDGLDPSIMPSTGTPEPGGLSWQQTCFALQELFATRTVVGMDVNELAPIETLHGPDFLVAKLIYKAIGYKFAKS
ncbi:MAG TPA: agmatinase [Pantanalinema sp.]